MKLRHTTAAAASRPDHHLQAETEFLTLPTLNKLVRLLKLQYKSSMMSYSYDSTPRNLKSDLHSSYCSRCQPVERDRLLLRIIWSYWGILVIRKTTTVQAICANSSTRTAFKQLHDDSFKCTEHNCWFLRYIRACKYYVYMYQYYSVDYTPSYITIGELKPE